MLVTKYRHRCHHLPHSICIYKYSKDSKAKIGEERRRVCAKVSSTRRQGGELTLYGMNVGTDGLSDPVWFSLKYRLIIQYLNQKIKYNKT